MPTHRSTAWLNGQMQWHIHTETTPTGVKASTPAVPDLVVEAPESHQAVNKLKETLRGRAVRGDL